MKKAETPASTRVTLVYVSLLAEPPLPIVRVVFVGVLFVALAVCLTANVSPFTAVFAAVVKLPPFLELLPPTTVTATEIPVPKPATVIVFEVCVEPSATSLTSVKVNAFGCPPDTTVPLPERVAFGKGIAGLRTMMRAKT